jgi:cysteine desulfurase
MIYLDYNATTPVDPRVAEAMKPFLREEYGNPSSQHPIGQRARQALETARGEVAALLGCRATEVVFTSGGSESNNTAIKGVAYAHRGRSRHIITSQVEHPAVLEPCRYLEAEGVEVTYLEVDGQGRVDPDAVKRALRPNTILISIMHANNEVGTIQPVDKIGKIAREAGVLFHTDAAQSAGKIPTGVADLGVDFLTVAGHKLYAPKGIGALFVRDSVTFVPLIHGASQEGGRRAGTENVLLSVALGAACRLAAEGLQEEVARIRGLRDRLHQGLQERLAGLTLNGHPEERLPNTLNVSIPKAMGSALLAELDEIHASTGAACHAGSTDISPVLRAMGVPEEAAVGAVRFSLGRWTTQEEVDQVVEAVAAWAKRRGRKGLWGWIRGLWGEALTKPRTSDRK